MEDRFMEAVTYGSWYHIQNFYLPDNKPTFLDVNGGAACAGNYNDVSANFDYDRSGQGTGTWRFVSATGKAPGDPVCHGDKVYIQNLYGTGGYLDVCGNTKNKENILDVQTSYVRHRWGTGSTTSLWIVKKVSNPSGADVVAMSDQFYLQNISADGSVVTYLDACGNSLSGARNDVSTARTPTRAGGTGTWCCLPYNNDKWKQNLGPNVPPNTLRIEMIQCVFPSSGVAGAQVVATASAIVGTAIGAAVGIAVTATSAGVAAPLGIGVGAMSAVSATAMAEAITLGARQAALGIGANFADQAYLKLNGAKVWPVNDSFLNMNKGDVVTVGYQTSRAGGTAYMLELFDHDLILSDDLLYSYQLEQDRELVNGMILAINPVEASSYVIYVTATRDKPSHDVLIAQHNADMARK
jgi:hypothetical protein